MESLLGNVGLAGEIGAGSVAACHEKEIDPQLSRITECLTTVHLLSHSLKRLGNSASEPDISGLIDVSMRFLQRLHKAPADGLL